MTVLTDSIRIINTERWVEHTPKRMLKALYLPFAMYSNLMFFILYKQLYYIY